MEKFLKKYIDEEHKEFLRWVFTLAIPIMIQEMIFNSSSLVDQLMIGTLGEASIAAVGLANQVFFIMILIVYGVVSGASTLIGQYWGKRETGYDPTDEIRKVAGISLTFNLVIATTFFIAARMFPETLMGVYSKDAEVIKIGSDYLRAVSFAFFLAPINLTISASLRSTQNTKTPMYCTFCAILVNIVFNYIFIYILGYGVVGAAMATVMSRITELTLLLIGLKVNDHVLYCKLTQLFKFDKELFGKYMKVATPVILNELTWVTGVSMYNKAYGLRGTEAQASVLMAQTIKNFFTVAGMAVGTTATIIISNTLGNGFKDKAELYAKRYLKLSVGIAFVMAFVFLGFAPIVLSIYDVSDTVYNMAYLNCIIYATIIVFQTYNYTGIIGILRSGGDNNFTLALDAFCVWGVAVPVAFMIGIFTELPVQYILIGTGCEEYVKILIVRNRVKSGKWVNTLV